MKILIIGSDKHYAIENIYVKYLKESGAEVLQYAAQSLFYDYYYHSILHKILYKLGLSNILDKINSEILELSAAFRPDFLWVFKGMEILPKTLVELKSSGAILVNYNPDNPFLFSGKGSGNKKITDSIKLYDIHFTYSESIKSQLEKTTPAKVFLLPFGYDIDITLLERVQIQKEILKTCFLGNPDVHRAVFISKLAQSGVRIDVYGHSWNKFVNHSNIDIYPPVYGDEFWFTLYKYRIQLNLMRPHNEASHNMRSFEVPGVGGIGLFPENSEHRFFFAKDKEVFMYKSFEECVSKIQYLLSRSNFEAIQIRNFAKERSLSSGYSYQSRAKYVFDVLKKFTSN